jgi:hypothetical protein
MKQRIMATAPLMDILHMATLINSHLQPRLHGITSSKKDVDPLYKEINCSSGKKSVNLEIIQKRRLVFRKRLSATVVYVRRVSNLTIK